MSNTYFVSELPVYVTVSSLRLGLLGARDYAWICIESQALRIVLST